jgi:hypothetical protein
MTDVLMELMPVSYEMNDTPGRVRFGFIAQDVERVLPEIVSRHDDGPRSIAYTELIAPLVKGVQEQQLAIRNLSERLAQLEQRLS